MLGPILVIIIIIFAVGLAYMLDQMERASWVAKLVTVLLAIVFSQIALYSVSKLLS